MGDRVYAKAPAVRHLGPVRPGHRRGREKRLHAYASFSFFLLFLSSTKNVVRGEGSGNNERHEQRETLTSPLGRGGRRSWLEVAPPRSACAGFCTTRDLSPSPGADRACRPPGRTTRGRKGIDRAFDRSR